MQIYKTKIIGKKNNYYFSELTKGFYGYFSSNRQVMITEYNDSNLWFLKQISSNMKKKSACFNNYLSAYLKDFLNFEMKFIDVGLFSFKNRKKEYLVIFSGLEKED